MKMKTMIFITMVVFFAVNGLNATDIDFYDDGIIQTGDEYDNVNVYNEATVDMLGGYIHLLNIYNSGTFNMSNGFVTNVMQSENYSTVNITDGNIARLTMLGSSTANLYGGYYEYYISAFELSVINIYGYNFHYDNGFLSGYWPNNSPFNVYLRGPETYPRVVIHEIPEPHIISSMVLGYVLIIRRKKQFS